jgi:simple sugar transport system permease protein
MSSGERAARYAGIPVRRATIGVLLCSGALAGVAGAVEMMGDIHTFATSLSGGTGYTAIVVAVLAGGSLAAVVPFALMFGGLDTAALSLRVMGISNNAAFALTGLILMLAAAAQVLAKYRLVKVASQPPALNRLPAPGAEAAVTVPKR